MTKPNPKKRDPYFRLKYLGYFLSQLPDTFSTKDLVRYAKFYLAAKTKTLMKDPIWDNYTSEELLIEFFAYRFQDESFRVPFEQQLDTRSGVVDEFAAWADKEMKKEAKIRDKILGGLEDRVSFDPKDIMGEDS